MEIEYDRNCFVIFHNGSDIIHPMEVLNGTIVSSGQPFYEEFENKKDWKKRLFQLGYNVSEMEIPKSPGPIKKRKLKEFSPELNLE